MRGSYCTSNWFYGLIAVFYQSRHLKDVKQLYLSHPLASLNPSQLYSRIPALSILPASTTCGAGGIVRQPVLQFSVLGLLALQVMIII